MSSIVVLRFGVLVCEIGAEVHSGSRDSEVQSTRSGGEGKHDNESKKQTEKIKQKDSGTFPPSTVNRLKYSEFFCSG